MRNIKYIIIHCTATNQKATLKSITDYWHNVLKWNIGGYHYLIFPNGKIEKLYPISQITNGVKGFNPEAVHISYVGGVDEQLKAIDNRTPSQKESILEVIGEIYKELRKHQEVDGILIRGHRDFSPDKNGNNIIDPWERIKECPCFDVIKEYGWLQGTKALNHKRLIY